MRLVYSVRLALPICSQPAMLTSYTVPYSVIGTFNIIYRYHFINAEGVCIIGMKTIPICILLSLEVLTSVYLTALFLFPLRKLYSFKVAKKPALRSMAKRTIIGSGVMIVVNLLNIGAVAILDGEKAWICLTCCNADSMCYCLLGLNLILT